jgi:hypothetical protein
MVGPIAPVGRQGAAGMVCCSFFIPHTGQAVRAGGGISLVDALRWPAGVLQL